MASQKYRNNVGVPSPCHWFLITAHLDCSVKEAVVLAGRVEQALVGQRHGEREAGPFAGTVEGLHPRRHESRHGAGL